MDQARRWSDRAVMLAREAAHAFTLVYALIFSSWFHQFCQERAVAQERAEEANAIASKQGLAVALAGGTIFRGWALARQGDAGIAQMRQGVAALRAAGQRFAGTYFLTMNHIIERDTRYERLQSAGILG
jgi:hypothetical protein